MLKKIAIVLVVLVLIVVGVLAFAAVSANKIANKFKPEIEAQASSALGSKVTLGSLEASVLPSVALKIGELKVQGDSPSEVFTLNNIRFNLDLMSLLSGVINITTLSIEEPSVVFEKDAAGVSIAGLPKAKGAAKPAAPASTDSGAAPQLPDALKVNLKEFSIKDAKVLFRDLVAKDEKSVTKINLRTGVEVKGNDIALPALAFSAMLMDKAPLSINSDGISYNIGSKSAALNALALKVFDGEIKASGKAAMSGAQEFKFEVHGGGFDLAQAVAVAQPALSGKLTGALSALNLQINGNLGNNLLNSITGQGDFKAKDVTVKGTNIVGDVVKALEAIPAAPGDGSNSDDLSAASGNDTAIQSINASYRLSGGIINLSDLKIVSPIFTITGAGKSTFDGAIDLTTEIALSPKLSAALANRRAGLKQVLSADGRLVIPLSIKGKAPQVAILPNVEKIVQIALEKGLADKAGKALDKALGGKGNGIGKLLGF